MLPSLLELHLSACGIQKLPHSPLRSVNFTSLLVLDISLNAIKSSFPSWFFNLTSLKKLDLHSNQLSGPIPQSIGNLSSLKTLNISANHMNGSIPESLGELSQLIFLDLSSNSWEGNLTEAHFRTLKKLKSFAVSTDRPLSLIFNVAHDWVPPFQLDSLYIVNCRIGPAFGVWPQSQTELRDLTLSNTGISDFIPEEWLLKISLQLTRLNLSYNQFRGKLPFHMNSSSLLYIDLSRNQFEGPLPQWSCDAVVYLDLQSNTFSGQIPSNYDQLLPNLTYWSLSDNNLSGSIPPSLCNMSSLRFLILRSNHLSGEFPRAWPYMEVVDLSNNNFTGQIPESISSLIGLRMLNLSRNQLTGNIPSKIGHVRLIETLDLSHNLLSGHIPHGLSLCYLLSHLDLSYNNLSGIIPSSYQLQFNDSSIYEANPSLCGLPLSTLCPGDAALAPADPDDDDHNGKLGMYVSGALGFIIGFWSVCGTLVMKKSWRYAYFRFFDKIQERAELFIAVRVARWQRKT